MFILSAVNQTINRIRIHSLMKSEDDAFILKALYLALFILQTDTPNPIRRTSDSGNGNHSVSLPIILKKKSWLNTFIFIYISARW